MFSESNLTLKALQEHIKQKDFHPELKHQYFLKLSEEVGELAKAIRKEKRLDDMGGIKGTIEEELYDVLYYIAALANVYGIDLEQCCRLKEAINAQKYSRINADTIRKL